MMGSTQFAGYCCYMCSEAQVDTFVSHGKWCVGRGHYAKNPGPHPSELAEKHDVLKSQVNDIKLQVSNLSSEVKRFVLLLKALLAMGLGTIALKAINKWRAK